MRIQKKLVVGLMLFVLTLAASIPLTTQEVSAQLSTESEVTALTRTLEWKNSGTIVGEFKGQPVYFIKGKCSDPNSTTVIPSALPDCFKAASLACLNKETAIFPQGSGYVLKYNLRNGGACNNTQGSKPVTIKKPANQNIEASRLNADTLVTSDGSKFIKAANNVYLKDSEAGQKCQDFIQVSGNRAKYFVLVDGTQSGFANYITANQASLTPAGFGTHATGSDERECGIVSINGERVDWGVGQGVGFRTEAEALARISQLAGQTFTLGTVTADELAAITGGDASRDEEFSCDAQLSSILSWILCPVINLSASFTQFVFESFVQPFLESVPISSNPQDGSYKAWQQFRLIGNIVLVGTMIAVVYAQVRGDR